MEQRQRCQPGNSCPMFGSPKYSVCSLQAKGQYFYATFQLLAATMHTGWERGAWKERGSVWCAQDLQVWRREYTRKVESLRSDIDLIPNSITKGQDLQPVIVSLYDLNDSILRKHFAGLAMIFAKKRSRIGKC